MFNVCIFFINGNPTLLNEPRNLLGKSPEFTILDSWVFDVLLSDELFARALQSLKTCVY